MPLPLMSLKTFPEIEPGEELAPRLITTGVPAEKPLIVLEERYVLLRTPSSIQTAVTQLGKLVALGRGVKFRSVSVPVLRLVTVKVTSAILNEWLPPEMVPPVLVSWFERATKKPVSVAAV